MVESLCCDGLGYVDIGHNAFNAHVLSLLTNVVPFGACFSTCSRAKAAAVQAHQFSKLIFVSTHSRAEAAARSIRALVRVSACFNTQPRGGGCDLTRIVGELTTWFQHTAARRRLPNYDDSKFMAPSVSTHSRAEAAASGDVAAGRY